MSVLTAYRQVPFEGLGYIEPAVRGASCAVRVIDAESPYPSPESIAELPGLILLGGPMSANDNTPFLRHQLAALDVALRESIPILGICLGAQLLAKAAGAQVYRNQEPEIGFFNIQLTPAGVADPILGKLDRQECVFHWHSDTFSLPRGSELLAYSASKKNQAYRIENFAYGLQFHPEVTPAMIGQWVREDQNSDIAEIETPFDANYNAKRLADVAEIIFTPWIDLVRKRSQCIA